MLNKHKKIGFSGDGGSYQNGVSECDIKKVVAMAKIRFVNDVMRCPK